MFCIFLVVNVEKYCTMVFFFRNYSMEHMANLLNILPEANKPVSSAVSIVCLSKTNRVVNPVQVPRLICFSMKFILPR